MNKNIKTASSIVLFALAIITLSWFLPWLYSFALPSTDSSPFVLFSPTQQKFIFSEISKDNGTKIYDLDGKEYTIDDRDALVPTFYYNQLMKKGMAPDTINGVEVSMKFIRHNSPTMRYSPRDINAIGPKVFLILESMPKRASLEEPKEVFRINNDGMEFIDMATNTLNKKRSVEFTAMLKKKGFTFPARCINGNPDTRKGEDQGYLIIDNDGKLYQVKQQLGKPYVRKYETKTPLKYCFITELPEVLGLVTDESNKMYAVTLSEGKLKELGIDSYNPEKETFLNLGDPFFWTIKLSDKNGYRMFALNADTFERVAEYKSEPVPTPTIFKAASYIFPFEISFTSYIDKFATPRLDFISWNAIYLNILLALIFALINRRKGKKAISGIVCTVIFGIFAFIPFLIFKK